jgi:hypothetical protein
MGIPRLPPFEIGGREEEAAIIIAANDHTVPGLAHIFSRVLTTASFAFSLLLSGLPGLMTASAFCVAARRFADDDTLPCA